MANVDFSNIDISSPDFSGYLYKRSMWLKEWRKRYFILKGNKLYFSKTGNCLLYVPHYEISHMLIRHHQEGPHGVIDLSECLTVKSAEEKTNKRNCFEVATPESTFYMYAENEKEKDEWIGAIGRAIVKFSSAYTGDDGCDEEE